MTRSLIWISGASSGIGAALAQAVPYVDAHVIDISRSGGAAGAEHLPADLADPSSWSAFEAHARAQLGGFSGDRVVFFHCAGTLEPIGFAGEVDSAAYRSSVLLNSAAGQALGHAFLAALRAAELDVEAHLVMISSGAAGNPYPGWSGYSAGKAALEAWVRAVGAEQTIRGSRCRVIAVAPGVVATPMQKRIRQADEHDFPNVARFNELHEQDQLRAPADVARDLWGLLDRDLANGAVLDLRSVVSRGGS